MTYRTPELARLFPHSYTVVISTETEIHCCRSHVSSRYNFQVYWLRSKYSLVSRLYGIDKNPIKTIYDVVSVLGVLMESVFNTTSASHIRMFFHDNTCLEGCRGCRIDGSGVFGSNENHSCNSVIIAVIYDRGTSGRNYHITPTEVTADKPVRTTCFSEAYYTAFLSPCNYQLHFRDISVTKQVIQVARFV